MGWSLARTASTRASTTCKPRSSANMYNAAPNTGRHAHFLRDLHRAMLDCEAAGNMLALIAVQIDQLERVAGTLGHAASATLAAEFCGRVRPTLRDSDNLLQVGDRRFYLILQAPRNQGHAELAANKLARIGKGPFQIHNLSLKLETVIGMAMYPEHASEVEELVRRADQALATAREENVAFCVYSDSNTREMRSIWQVEHELDRALQESEFELYYQPKIDLRTRVPCGAEALIRWNNPARGLLSPNMFLPLAERAGKLEAITWFVLDVAQRQRCEWPERWGELPVSVNIPPSVLDGGHLIEYIKTSLPIWGSKTSHLILEVTEDAIVKNPQQSFAALAKLRGEGVRVSIDDFGTGYSSLSYFKDIPADELKIDMSFIRNLSRDPGNQHIVRAVINLAHTFNFRVVAEGVEREEDLAVLLQMGCDIGQGYLFSRPQAQADFMRWLDDYPATDVRPTQPSVASPRDRATSGE